MNKLVSLIFFLGFLAVASTVSAQGGTDPYTSVDTLFSVEELEADEEEGSYFNRIGTALPAEVRTIPDSVVEKTRADEDYWYLQEKPKKKEQKADAEAREPGWRKWLFWILIIGVFIAILVWSLVTGDVRLFRRAPRAVPKAEEEEQELETEDIFSINFDRELEKARSVRNFRLMVRLYYLRTLKDLSQRGFIDYAHDRTNSVYLAQLSGTNHYRDFFRITRHFEYTWYGKFPVTEAQFGLMEQDFLHFKQRFA